jgi:hypothetical protein
MVGNTHIVIRLKPLHCGRRPACDSVSWLRATCSQSRMFGNALSISTRTHIATTCWDMLLLLCSERQAHGVVGGWWFLGRDETKRTMARPISSGGMERTRASRRASRASDRSATTLNAECIVGNNHSRTFPRMYTVRRCSCRAPDDDDND